VLRRAWAACSKRVSNRLTEGGGDDLFELGAEQGDAHLPVSLPVEQVPGDQHLAEDAGGLGQRQWRMVMVEVLSAGQHVVCSVTELMGEGGNIAQGVGVVEQHIGISAGVQTQAEGPAAFGVARRHIEPAGFGQRGDRRRQLGVKPPVGLLYQLPGLGKREVPLPTAASGA